MAKKRLLQHDKFARSMMANPKVVQEFFHKNLPDELRDSLDFSSLHMEKESYIDDGLKSQITDLLYKADFHGRPGFLYLLIEHASKSHPFLPFRLLKYMLAIMEEHLKTAEIKELPIVYPMILYTGKSPYKHTVDLFDLFKKEDREIAKKTLFSPYHLIDLTQVSDEELRKELWYGTMARVLKHIHDADILPFFKGLVGTLKIVEAHGEEGYINKVVTYVATMGETPHQEELYQSIKEIGTGEEEKLMTLVEYLKEKLVEETLQKGLAEGRTQGLEQGLEQGKTETARNMLAKGADPEFISSVTGFSKKEISKLMN